MVLCLIRGCGLSREGVVLCLPQREQRDVCTCNIPGYKMVLVPGSNSRGVEDDTANLQIETLISLH